MTMIGDLDIFHSGSSILFNEPEINVGDFGEEFNINFKDLEPITVGIAKEARFSLFAHHIWKASILLSLLLIEHKEKLYNVKVLELGAGAGIPSIVASMLGAQVVATDYPDEILINQLQANMTRNKRDVVVKPHLWGSELDGKFDIILMADTLWMRDQHQNLLKDLNNLLLPTGMVLGVAGLHSGREIFEEFFELAQENGFLVKKVSVRIPLGSGFCEQEDWTEDEHVIYTKEERSKFLFKFILQKQ